MNHSKTLSVTLLGKEFGVNCPSGSEENLMEAANFLNRAMLNIQKQGRVSGLERIVVMAALNIANDLLVTNELLAIQKQEESQNQTQTQTQPQTISENVEDLQPKPKIEEAAVLAEDEELHILVTA